ncbi:MAG: 30S ribosomal protein S16 [Elusimicrobia bacterium]|nr:30S ribosomal protein S16 [Elusimicrobiota bacterium]
MAVVIRLQRTGKPKQPYYRVVAVEKSRGPVGKPIEVLGWYNPREDKAADKVKFDAARYEYWVKNGAKPSGTVATLLKGRTGQEKGAVGGAKS